MLESRHLCRWSRVYTYIGNFSPTAEFAEASRAVQVSEPEDGATASISLTVERTGGATGVVEVSWSITADNGEPTTTYHY